MMLSFCYGLTGVALLQILVQILGCLAQSTSLTDGVDRRDGT